MTAKKVWLFKETNTNENLLGIKGANLAKMTNLGLPVPSGFTITTETCMDYINNNNTMPAGLMDEVRAALKAVEEQTGKNFGDTQNPLLVSVRSGTTFYPNGLMEACFDKLDKKFSINTPSYIISRNRYNFTMPGIPETILNIGLNDEIIEVLSKKTNNPRFYYNSYITFLSSFGSVVYNINKIHLDLEIKKIYKIEKTEDFNKISIHALKYLINKLKEKIKEISGKEITQNPYQQLQEIIEATYRCWHNPIAFKYRENNNINHNTGVAISIQTMVFGNLNNYSATGFVFSRDPIIGENLLKGEYLINTQGEDIVKSSATPIAELQNKNSKIYKQLQEISKKLELKYKHAQFIEFVIEDNKLWILQARTSKNSPNATVRINIEMYNENIITKENAILNTNINTINSTIQNEYFQTLNKWIDEYKTVKVGANISHPEEIPNAIYYGADLVGLCRTECLLPRTDIVEDSWVYRMLNAPTSKKRKAIIYELKDKQYQDYYEMLKAFDGKDFIIRLSDYPLETFILDRDKSIKQIIENKINKMTTKNDEATLDFLQNIRNSNPMIGLRGTRLAIIYPELFEMQLEAVFEATCRLIKEGLNIKLNIMASLVSHVNELKLIKNLIKKTETKITNKEGIKLNYKIGTMIETPRAALTADELAEHADFFSFGTNDLTQMTFGYSRDDFTSFLNNYLRQGILPQDPFLHIDQNGVGELIKISINKGKEKNNKLKLGVCGIQSRNLDSVIFAIENNLDYISIDPPYIPQAKLLSAQLNIQNLKSHNNI